MLNYQASTLAKNRAVLKRKEWLCKARSRYALISEGPSSEKMWESNMILVAPKGDFQRIPLLLPLAGTTYPWVAKRVRYRLNLEMSATLHRCHRVPLSVAWGEELDLTFEMHIRSNKSASCVDYFFHKKRKSQKTTFQYLDKEQQKPRTPQLGHVGNAFAELARAAKTKPRTFLFELLSESSFLHISPENGLRFSGIGVCLSLRIGNSIACELTTCLASLPRFVGCFQKPSQIWWHQGDEENVTRSIEKTYERTSNGVAGWCRICDETAVPCRHIRSI